MTCLPPLSLMNINLSGLTLIPDKLQLFKKKKKKITNVRPRTCNHRPPEQNKKYSKSGPK